MLSLLLNQVATQLSLRGWVDSAADLIRILNCGSAGNWTRDLMISSQARWPLDKWVGLDKAMLN